jgi:hypothetical protein
LGKIHLGVKIARGWRCQNCRQEISGQGKDKAPPACRCGGEFRFIEYPKAVDYFVLPHEEGNPEHLTPIGMELAKVYGPQPRELDVVFPIEDTDKLFEQWLKCYRGSVGLWCKGDGQDAQRRNDKGVFEVMKCPYQECDFYKRKACQETANLMVMLPRVSIGGCFQIDTGSFNSIQDVNSGFDMVRSHIGRISWVPCKLRVVPRQVSPDGKKKTVWTLSLALATWEEVRVFGRELVALRKEFRDGLALPAPQQDAFEETHLISQSVQDGAAEFDPEEAPPEGGKVIEGSSRVIARTAADVVAEAVGKAKATPEPEKAPQKPQTARQDAPKSAPAAPKPAEAAKPPATAGGVDF